MTHLPRLHKRGPTSDCASSVAVHVALQRSIGEPEKVDEVRAKEILEHEDLEVRVDVGIGNESATYWTCDFSYVRGLPFFHKPSFVGPQYSFLIKFTQEYVRINGDYRS